MEKRKKALVVATVVKKHIMQFHVPTLKLLQEMGYETHVAASNDYENLEECNIPYCDEYHDINFSRKPYKLKNIKAYKELKKIIKNEQFNIIHCHTPVGGVIGRYAARKERKSGTIVIYTAHGFHFYKGAPLKNRIIYYPIEKYMSRYTDVLITINKEDYNLAKSKFNATNVEYVRGVGINLNKYKNNINNNNYLYNEFDLSNNKIVLLTVGELISRKNYETVINSMKNLIDSGYKNVLFLICGSGDLENKLKEQVKLLKLDKYIKFLGYRNDVSELLSISDIFVFPSFQEGLPVAVIEAMTSGLPIIASNIRGVNDLIENGKGGYLGNPKDVDFFANSIIKLINNRDERIKFGNINIENVNDLDISTINKCLFRIYNDVS